MDGTWFVLSRKSSHEIFKIVLHEERCLLLSITSIDLLRKLRFYFLWRIGISYGAERCELTLYTPDVN